jgi:hypothetical protein
MTKLMSGHQVNQPIVRDRSGAASETIAWNGWPFLPAVGGGIVDVHVRQWRLTSSRSGERAEDVDLPVEHHGLEMMHRHGRRGSGFPCPGGDVEDLDRLWRLPAADKVEPFPHLDVPGFESREMLPYDLENVPPAPTGLLGIARPPTNREYRREHPGR